MGPVCFQMHGFASTLGYRNAYFHSTSAGSEVREEQRLAECSQAGMGSWAWILALLTPSPRLFLHIGRLPQHQSPSSPLSHSGRGAKWSKDSELTAELGPRVPESPHSHSSGAPAQRSVPFLQGAGTMWPRRGSPSVLCTPGGGQPLLP